MGRTIVSLNSTHKYLLLASQFLSHPVQAILIRTSVKHHTQAQSTAQLNMSYYSGTPRRRGGGSGGSNYTTTPGRESSGLHAGGSLTYEVPPAISRPSDPITEPVPRLDGPPPRALGFSSAATTPMRGRTSATPSVRSSSSSSAASQHSRPGSAAGTGRPGGNPSPPRQDAYLAQFGGAGLPPSRPQGMVDSVHARAAARRAEPAPTPTPNPFNPLDLPPAPPPGMGRPGGPPPAGHPPAGSQPGASGQTPKRPGPHSPPGPSGRGGKK
ncbi:uncharacterized protein APUU_50059A [Aspergillus puulaauensis]|uniref:Uncharacterized protein n=1 Tax=Aspergillus puulaauensis TaxID=1220207 RepID=A0A7R7XQY6_9EURO|nr:uncharacterized protein APUU_50059A [Aspergillus puulaauensis]BCS25348.1 hypothetical protein APUU_50059A [Aspergillus puulaauensis]